MRRYEMVKKHSDFDDIIHNGAFVKNKAYIIYNKVNDLEFNRYGIAVGKKIGDAHIRNRVKRQVREIITSNKKLFQNNKDYIIIVKKSVLEMDFETMNNMMISLLK